MIDLQSIASPVKDYPEGKSLDEGGRCCGRKPLTYKRDRIRFCYRCDRAYDLEENRQVSNWATPLSIANSFAAYQLAAIKLDAAAQADSARRYMDMRRETALDLQRGQALAIRLSQALDRTITPDTSNEDFRLLPDGFTIGEHKQGKCGGSAYCPFCEAQEEAERDYQSCANCSIDLESGWALSDYGRRICFRCEEHAIEAARCQHCGKDDCRDHTNAELLARGGGDL